jgi:proline dehydrogenase
LADSCSVSALRRVLRTAWEPVSRRVASVYVVGPGLDDAVRAFDRLERRGLPVTIGFWNRDDDDPALVAERQLETIARLGDRRLDWYLSTKLPALGFDDDLCQALLDAGRAKGVRIHFDALGPETADATLARVAEAASTQPVSLALPSRWRRSLDDAERTIELGVPVRIVKGQWEDPDAPDRDPVQGYLELVDRLAGRAPHVSIATHNVRLAAEAMKRLRAAGTPHDLELLLSLPLRKQMATARAHGTPVRIYLAFGHNSAPPYFLRELVRHPARIGWLARDVLRSWLRPVSSRL